MTIYAGIDVGLKGAIVVMDEQFIILATHRFYVDPKPGKITGQLNGKSIFEFLTDLAVERVYIENPLIVVFDKKKGNQKSLSIHGSQGHSLGTVQAACAIAGIEYKMIQPAQWKKEYQLSGKPKRASCDVAMSLMPDLGKILVKDADIAEAALIGRYGIRQKPF